MYVPCKYTAVMCRDEALAVIVADPTLGNSMSMYPTSHKLLFLLDYGAMKVSE